MAADLLQALLTLLSFEHLAYLLVGTTLGLMIGILPGLGGTAMLSLLLPFVFGKDPGPVLAMMVGLLAVNNTSDTFPAVLMGIPGSSSSQATIMDGFPLARKGEAARALGAALSVASGWQRFIEAFGIRPDGWREGGPTRRASDAGAASDRSGREPSSRGVSRPT